jgi:hypothetical protein
MAGWREEALTLVESYGFWINARFKRQFANEHEAAGMAIFMTLLILLKLDRDYRPGRSIHLQLSPCIHRYFFKRIETILNELMGVPAMLLPTLQHQATALFSRMPFSRMEC